MILDKFGYRTRRVLIAGFCGAITFVALGAACDYARNIQSSHGLFIDMIVFVLQFIGFFLGWFTYAIIYNIQGNGSSSETLVLSYAVLGVLGAIVFVIISAVWNAKRSRR
jgi:hypothetical protein